LRRSQREREEGRMLYGTKKEVNIPTLEEIAEMTPARLLSLQVQTPV
jgi:hypothetical protein